MLGSAAELAWFSPLTVVVIAFPMGSFPGGRVCYLDNSGQGSSPGSLLALGRVGRIREAGPAQKGWCPVADQWPGTDINTTADELFANVSHSCRGSRITINLLECYWMQTNRFYDCSNFFYIDGKLRKNNRRRILTGQTAMFVIKLGRDTGWLLSGRTNPRPGKTVTSCYSCNLCCLAIVGCKTGISARIDAFRSRSQKLFLWSSHRNPKIYKWPIFSYNLTKSYKFLIIKLVRFFTRRSYNWSITSWE